MDLEIGRAGLREVCTCFIDDLLGHAKTAADHLRDVTGVLDMLAACGLKAHPAKSCFFADKVEYLGHYIGADGLTPHQAKIAAVAGLRVPTNVSELRSVLGFLNYYRCYTVPDFSAMAAPLNRLLGAEVPWQWSSVEHDAYQSLKDAMCRPGAALKHLVTRTVLQLCMPTGPRRVSRLCWLRKTTMATSIWWPVLAAP